MSSQDGFKQLYDQHVRMVYNLCLNHLRNKDEAAEATQDVFLKVHEKLAGFKGDASVKTWIYRITVNTCLDRIKAAKRKKRAFFGISLSAEERTAEVPVFDHPGVLLEEREAMERLFADIDALPENQRTALLLKGTEGLSMDEIAVVMGTSAKAVESLLSRARSTLRVRMERTKDNGNERRQSDRTP